MTDKSRSSIFTLFMYHFQLENDEGFKEFIALHSKSNSKKSWTNEETANQVKPGRSSDKSLTADSKQKLMLDYAFEGESDSSDDETLST